MELNTICWTLVIFSFQKMIVMDAFQKLVDHLKIHHITAFANYIKERDFEIDFFFQHIVRHNPTTNIDLTTIELTDNSYRTTNRPIYQNPRQFTAYIILQGKNYSMKINDTLDRLIQISPIGMRPKCLVIFSQYENLLEDETKKILYHAWTLKFLDFAILRVGRYGNPIDYVHYNPFKNIFNAGYLKGISDLFPDKLVDVNQYPLRLAVFDFPPYMVFQTQNNNVISANGNVPFVYFIDVAKKLNFELNFIYHQGETLGKEFHIALSSIERGETNAIPVRFHFTNYIVHLKILLGDALEISKWVMTVPILMEYTLDIPFETSIYVVSFILIVTIFAISLHVLKIKSEKWNIMNLFGVLIGMGVSQPTKDIDRIIFFTLAIVSIVYTGNFFSTLADIKVSGTVKEINTYEDIKKLKIPVYTHGVKEVFNDSEFQRNIVNHKIMFNHSDCFSKLFYARNAICVTDYRSAIYTAANNLNTDGKPISKILDISIAPDFVGFLYEKASPFTEKFNKLIQQMIELSVSPDRYINHIKLHSVSAESSVNDDAIIKTALAILFLGFFLATLAFIYELYTFKTLVIRGKIRFEKSIFSA